MTSCTGLWVQSIPIVDSSLNLLWKSPHRTGPRAKIILKNNSTWHWQVLHNSSLDHEAPVVLPVLGPVGKGPAQDFTSTLTSNSDTQLLFTNKTIFIFLLEKNPADFYYSYLLWNKHTNIHKTSILIKPLVPGELICSSYPSVSACLQTIFPVSLLRTVTAWERAKGGRIQFTMGGARNQDDEWMLW